MLVLLQLNKDDDNDAAANVVGVVDGGIGVGVENDDCDCVYNCCQ